MAQDEIHGKILHTAADAVTGSTPIMYAAIENRISFMERMVNLGCDVNRKNKENYIALHFGNSDLAIEQYFDKDNHSQHVCTRGHCQLVAGQKVKSQSNRRTNEADLCSPG